MGKVIITEHSKQPNDILFCQSCDKKLADYTNGIPIPSYQELYETGAVPVPNFGWLCSQKCADNFEKETGITFQRDSEGKIDYYNGTLEI